MIGTEADPTNCYRCSEYLIIYCVVSTVPTISPMSWLDENPLLAFSVGSEIAETYNRMLYSVLEGQVLEPCLHLAFLTLCVLNPIFGYVPEFASKYNDWILAASLLLAYSVPYRSILPLGLLLSLDSIPCLLSDTTPAKARTVRTMGLVGFLAGRNIWVTDYLDFLGIVGPITMLIRSVSPESQVEVVEVQDGSACTYSREDMLSLLPEIVDIPPELANITLVPALKLRRK